MYINKMQRIPNETAKEMKQRLVYNKSRGQAHIEASKRH